MTTILSFSLVIWIIIDRFKKAWANCKYAGYITSLMAFILGAACSFYYQLDLIQALGLAPEPSIIGYCFSALAIMGGSSCIAEIMERLSVIPHTEV